MFQFRWVTRLALAVGIIGALVAAPSLGGSRTLKGAEAMSVQSVPGTWGSSISVLNPSTNTSAANITVDFYTPNGLNSSNSPGPIFTTQTTSPVQPGGTAFWFVPNLVGLAPNQTYSAIVSADQQVYATVNLNTMSGTTPEMGEEYNGIDATQTATQVFVPTVQRTYHGFTSNIVIQNTTLTAASVNMTITGVGSNGQVSVPVGPLAIAPSSSVTVDMAGQSGLGDGFNGAATINGGTNAIGAIVNDYTPLPLVEQVNSLFSSANAVAAGSGSSTIYVPSVSNNYHGFFSALVVQNVDSAPANVVVTYSDGVVDNTFQSSKTLGAGQSHLYFTPTDGPPIGFQGSATVTSPNGKLLLGTVDIQGTPGSDGGVGLSSYDAFAAGGTTVLAPGLVKKYFGFTSDLAVQNVDPSATIPPNGLTITYVSSTGMSVVEHNAGAIPPGGQYNSYQGNDAQLAVGFNGGATVVSNGPHIVGITSLSGDPTADQLFTTNAFVTP